MLPFFYQPNIAEQQKIVTLDEATSRHCIQVLRMQEGAAMLLTDGNGKKIDASIVTADKKKCAVRIIRADQVEKRAYGFSLAIAFTKNNSRNEWLLEKATEMGIEHIYPLICARSEKDKFNAARLQGILVSAMLQSQQCFLPQLHEPVALKKLVGGESPQQKMIAHCIASEERKPLLAFMQAGVSTLMLIGPEGDFTQDEITLSLASGFVPVSLGANRLRTETAGLYACTLFNALNYA